MLDSSAHFVILLGSNGAGVPVRFYRGLTGEPTGRTLRRQEIVAHRRWRLYETGLVGRHVCGATRPRPYRVASWPAPRCGEDGVVLTFGRGPV